MSEQTAVLQREACETRLDVDVLAPAIRTPSDGKCRNEPTSQPVKANTMDHPLPLHIDTSQRNTWRTLSDWLSSSKRGPLIRLEVEVHHVTSPPPRWGMVTRLTWSGVVIGAGIIVFVIMVVAVFQVMAVATAHPEFSRAVRQTIGDRMTRWEASNGIGCLIWYERATVEERRDDIANLEQLPDNLPAPPPPPIRRHGGPACPADKPLPADVEGDAP